MASQSTAPSSRLRTAGVGGATSLRGIWGFHGDHAPHGDHFLRQGHHVPAVTIVVDTPERIAEAFAGIDGLTRGRASSPARPCPPCQPGAAGPLVSPAA